MNRILNIITAVAICAVLGSITYDIWQYYTSCTTDTECQCTDDCLEPAK